MESVRTEEGFKSEGIYLPLWLIRLFAGKEHVWIIDIFSAAEKVYGKLSFSDREMMAQFLDDLEEEGDFSRKGNFAYLEFLQGKRCTGRLLP